MSGLRFTASDGSLATVTIQDTTANVYRQLRYTPGDPKPRSVTITDPRRDGDDVPITTFGNVVETAEATLYADGTVPGAQALKRDLERLFAQARHVQRYKRGPRVYLEFRVDGEVSWYRAEVKNGYCTLSDGVLDQWQLPMGDPQLTINVERAPFFEGPETALSLTNRYGTSTSLTVANIADGSRDNFLTLGSVDGDLPAPLQLRYANSYNSTRRVATLYAGMAVFSSGVTPSWLTFQIESAQPVGGTNQGSQWTWAMSASDTILGTFTLSSSLLTAAAGSPFRVFLRTPGGPSSAETRMDQYVAVSRLTEGSWARLQNGVELHEVGTHYLPPYLQGLGGGMADLAMRLWGRSQNTAGGGSLPLDLCFLLPAESYRVYETAGYGAAYGTTLIDRPLDGLSYTDGWSGGALGNVIPRGAPLLAVPGRTNRLYLLAVADTGHWELDRTGMVSVLYRPRRMHF